jgi:hypothetical protein
VDQVLRLSFLLYEKQNLDCVSVPLGLAIHYLSTPLPSHVDLMSYAVWILGMRTLKLLPHWYVRPQDFKWIINGSYLTTTSHWWRFTGCSHFTSLLEAPKWALTTTKRTRRKPCYHFLSIERSVWCQAGKYCHGHESDGLTCDQGCPIFHDTIVLVCSLSSTRSGYALKIWHQVSWLKQWRIT